jgi:hypothetical protein
MALLSANLQRDIVSKLIWIPEQRDAGMLSLKVDLPFLRSQIHVSGMEDHH